MELTLVRHGETIENASDTIMGHHGGTLSEKGIGQAVQTAEKLKDEKFDQAWSSDLRRCVDTAKYILKPHHNLQLQLTTALREVNYGEFQGRPGAEIRAFFDKEGGYTRTSQVPGGETQLDMSIRVLNFVNNLLDRHSNKRILLVSHNGPIEAIRVATERTPFSGDAKNAGILQLHITKPLELYPIP